MRVLTLAGARGIVHAQQHLASVSERTCSPTGFLVGRIPEALSS